MIGGFCYGAAAALPRFPLSFRIPLYNRGGFEIAENESPRPQDRIFLTGDFFGDTRVLRGGPTSSVFRQTIGFEKTFFGGDASFGARLPFLETTAVGNLDVDGLGDLTMIFKYALLNDRGSGNTLSGGLALTVPTGRDVVLPTGQHVNGVLFQPWAGFVWGRDRLYVQGFTSLVIPTAPSDVTFFATDVGVGYRLFEKCGDDRLLTQVIPTFEVHAYVPLNSAGVNSGNLVVLQNQLVVTSGVHLGLCNCGYLTVGLAVPIIGPVPYDCEALVQMNLRF
jgi:hypothetical protein